jgi:hypothetical protein
MEVRFKRILLFSLCSWAGIVGSGLGQQAEPRKIEYNQNEFDLYPKAYDRLPEVPSPLRTKDGREILLALLKNNQYALIPVTMENGSPLLYSKKIESLFGKDLQLQVDSGDFPSLAKTGLHSEADLDTKDMITGFPVSLITYIGRPQRFSTSGFMGDDEDIISVLKGDNRSVEKLGLTHPQLAKPLFHVWNIILKEIELGHRGHSWDNIPVIFYNRRKVLLTIHDSKGWQISIFQDEIQGSFNIAVHSGLSPEEEAFLKEKYSRLTDQQMTELREKLTRINFSEMAPYYIMRYGFYEGHTDWRCDPVAITFVFGLKSLAEIENIFAGDLYETLTEHFTQEAAKR